MITIREREDSDLDACAAILVAVHEQDGYPVEGVSDPRAWLVPPHLVVAWVAVNDENAIVGHVSLGTPQPDDAAAVLWQKHGNPAPLVAGRLFVAPSARDRGTARRLGEVLMSYAIEHDVRIVLDVMKKDAAAISLYEQNGWTQIGTTLHHFGDRQEAQALCYVSPAPTFVCPTHR